MDRTDLDPQEQAPTFLAVVVPEDGQGEPYEVSLPTDGMLYTSAVAQLLGPDLHNQWPRSKARKGTGPHLVVDRKHVENKRQLNTRATLLIGNEVTTKPIYGPALFCTSCSTDMPFTDVTLATYGAFHEQGSQLLGVDSINRVLLSALPKGAAGDQAQAVGIGASLPLVYKLGEWPFTKTPKALLFEYCERAHLLEAPAFWLEPNIPHGRFLYSATMLDFGLTFKPELEHAHRTKKEAEHQAALLVLQHLGGSPKCGQPLPMPDIALGGTEDNPLDTVNWLDIHGDGGIRKRIIREGSGQLASPGEWVAVHYEARIANGAPFDSTRKLQGPRWLQVNPPEDGRYEVIFGLHDGVATMRPQEVARFEIAPIYAYGDCGLPGHVPPNTTVQFEVEMLGKAPAKPEKDHDHVEDAEEARADGNVCYRNLRFQEALKFYHIGLGSLQKVKNPPPDELPVLDQLSVDLNCNAAAACLKLCNFEKAIFHATQALEVQPEAVKPLYRRGQAHLARHDFDLAQRDFERAFHLAEGDAKTQRDVGGLMRELREKRRQHDQRMGQMCARMLSVRDASLS